MYSRLHPWYKWELERESVRQSRGRIEVNPSRCLIVIHVGDHVRYPYAPRDAKQSKDGRDGTRRMAEAQALKDFIHFLPLMIYHHQYSKIAIRSKLYQPHDSFPNFLKLPVEVQQEIWNAACILEGSSNSRIQRIAPDPLYIPYSIENIQIRIICQESHPVPPLLHACGESRKVALKHWTLWPCAGPFRYRGDRSNIYVNKSYDIFYAGGAGHEKFWFLNRLMGLNHPELTEDEEALAAETLAQLDVGHCTLRLRLMDLVWSGCSCTGCHVDGYA
jgi:hypothetical protein